MPGANEFNEGLDQICSSQDQIISPRRVAAIEAERDWSRLHLEELREEVKAPEEGFELPNWIGHTSSNLAQAQKTNGLRFYVYQGYPQENSIH